MYPLFETIKVFDGEYLNIEYHQNRINKSSKDLWGKLSLDLKKSLPIIPQKYSKGIFKCRLFYNSSEFDLEIITYKLPDIKRLKLIDGKEINYSKKYTDRSAINTLFGKRGSCDDILITKNGLLCDTSYANIVLRTKDAYITPAKPLLNGTKREFYLSEKIIIEQDLKIDELYKSEGIYLINAMIDIEDNLFIIPENITK